MTATVFIELWNKTLDNLYKEALWVCTLNGTFRNEIWNVLSQFQCSSDLDFRKKPWETKKADCTEARICWLEMVIGMDTERQALNGSLDLWGVRQWAILGYHTGSRVTTSFKWWRWTNRRRKLRQENGYICGKNIHKNQEEKRSQKQVYLEH